MQSLNYTTSGCLRLKAKSAIFAKLSLKCHRMAVLMPRKFVKAIVVWAEFLSILSVSSQDIFLGLRKATIYNSSVFKPVFKQS